MFLEKGKFEMDYKSYAALACVVALLTAGCQRQEEEVVFAVVDGRPLTEEYVRQVVELRAEMMKMRGRAIPGNRFAAWANGTAMQLIPQLISADLWYAETLRVGEMPEKVDIDKCLGAICSATRRKISSPDEITSLFTPKMGPVAYEQFKRSAAFAAYTRRHLEPKLTEKEIDDYCSQQTNRVALAKLIDMTARKRGQDAWDRLQKGESWEKVAEECSEDARVDEENKCFAVEWATVGPDAMGNPELAQALVGLKEGAYSRPTETEEGLVIIRLVKKDDDQYVLARILFRMAEPVVIQSREEAMQTLRVERLEAAKAKLNADLVAKAKIEYPLGTNFTYQIWEESKQVKGPSK